jgi:pantoate--beta-alanine ligase
MKVVTTFREAREEARGRVVLVPTMGYFHEGHLRLMEKGRELGDTLLVSLFVNPLQFDDPDDLARYPRDPDRDARLAAEVGVDVLFVPPLEEMYPTEPLTRVVVSRLTETMEGVHRPGHFDGVATVVTKLLVGLRPHLAVFGRKDAQQLAVVRRLVVDLSIPVEIVGHPVVREPDGLALSSRNVFLGPDHRPTALELSRGLMAAADLVERGERRAAPIVAAVRDTGRHLDLEYVELVGQDDLTRIERLDRPAFLAAAARVGPVRLIDALFFDLSPRGEPVTDRGVFLEAPSVLYREAG